MGRTTDFEYIKCQGCGTNQSPLFFMPKARHAEDVWCKECMNKEMIRRGTE